MVNIADDAYPINVSIAGTYENFYNNYEIVNPATNPYFTVTSANPNRLTVTNLPRGNWPQLPYYVRRAITLPTLFTLYYKITLTRLDKDTVHFNNYGGDLIMMFTRDPNTHTQQDSSTNHDGIQSHIRSYWATQAPDTWSLIAHNSSKVTPTTCPIGAYGKNSCFGPAYSGHKWLCSAGTWTDTGTTCSRNYAEKSGNIDAQTLFPLNTPRWVKIVRRTASDATYYGTQFDEHVYSNNTYSTASEITNAIGGTTGSLDACYVPDNDPYNYFMPICIAATDGGQYMASAVLEDFLFTYP